jgi:hypothetical protein
MIWYQMSSEPPCLLDWNNLVLNPVAAAVPPDFDPSQMNYVPELSEPQPRHTSIWMPDGLVLSPLGREVWHHDDVVRKVGGRCLLWHTFASDTLEGDNLRLRAVWSRHLHPDPGQRDFPSSRGEPPVSPRVLHQIVHLTSNFGAGIRDRVSTLTSRYLMLSAFGAWVDAKGQWELGIQGIDLSEWFQRVSMGRDQYVRLAREGYLFPFGHRATCVDISERKLYAHELESLGVRIPFAHLRRHTLLIVREREKLYPEADEKTNALFRSDASGSSQRSHPSSIGTATIRILPRFSGLKSGGSDFSSRFRPRIGMDTGSNSGIPWHGYLRRAGTRTRTGKPAVSMIP